MEINSISRPSWDRAWMNVAHVLAERSACERDQVGAVVASPDNLHVSVGYNGPPSGLFDTLTLDLGCRTWCQRAQTGEAVPGYVNCPTIHAEANALLKSDASLILMGTLYVSSAICWGCAKLVANSGISRVVCDTTHTNAHRNVEDSFRLLRNSGIIVEEMRHG